MRAASASPINIESCLRHMRGQCHETDTGPELHAQGGPQGKDGFRGVRPPEENQSDVRPQKTGPSCYGAGFFSNEGTSSDDDDSDYFDQDSDELEDHEVEGREAQHNKRRAQGGCGPPVVNTAAACDAGTSRSSSGDPGDAVCPRVRDFATAGPMIVWMMSSPGSASPNDAEPQGLPNEDLDEQQPEEPHPDQYILMQVGTFLYGRIHMVGDDGIWLRILVKGVVKDGWLPLPPELVPMSKAGDQIEDMELVEAALGRWCHSLHLPYERPAQPDVTDAARTLAPQGGEVSVVSPRGSPGASSLPVASASAAGTSVRGTVMWHQGDV